jgi:hypothetical protein
MKKRKRLINLYGHTLLDQWEKTMKINEIKAIVKIINLNWIKCFIVNYFLMKNFALSLGVDPILEHWHYLLNFHLACFLPSSFYSSSSSFFLMIHFLLLAFLVQIYFESPDIVVLSFSFTLNSWSNYHLRIKHFRSHLRIVCKSILISNFLLWNQGSNLNLSKYTQQLFPSQQVLNLQQN